MKMRNVFAFTTKFTEQRKFDNTCNLLHRLNYREEKIIAPGYDMNKSSRIRKSGNKMRSRKATLWKELSNEAFSYFKCGEHQLAIDYYKRNIAEYHMNSQLDETHINKQVKDILRITGQNEVIQSFVRSDADREFNESVHENVKLWGKEKKFSSSSFAGITAKTTEKSKESKDDVKSRMSVVQSYQQLGKDARFSSKSARLKSGKKWSRRQRHVEEVYTDKDRAAAVNLGSRDIKQSLKMKRRQDRSRILEISEEAHPGTLLALAIHRFKTGDIYAALKFVDKALELNPYDRNALIARSRCYLLTGNAELALKDAEQTLEEDEFFIKGIYQKAEALYHLAQFEYSLMYFHRGLHIRKQENFKQGVCKARQAIINTVGKRVPSFDKFFPRRSNTKANKELTHNSNTFEDCGDQCRKFRSTNLKEFQTDKIYFKKLLHNPSIIYAVDQTRKDNKIFMEAADGVKFLENRQNFWRQQQPLNRKRLT